MSDLSSAPTAIVTGGSRGIGRGIAKMLAIRGWNLTIAARGVQALEEARTDLSRYRVQVRVAPCDLAEDQGNTSLVEDHLAAFGTLNALVLAAGVGYAAAIDGYPSGRLDRQLSVNIRSPFLLTAAALPALRLSAKGRPDGISRIIALSSLEGIFPEANLAAYGATKAALVSLINSINVEERISGIIATAISPGYVDTEMSDWISGVIPKSSMITVDDVAKCVELVFSMSPNAMISHIVLRRRAADYYQA